MRVLMLIALILAVLALICAAVPRTILGADWSVWLCAAFVRVLPGPADRRLGQTHQEVKPTTRKQRYGAFFLLTAVLRGRAPSSV